MAQPESPLYLNLTRNRYIRSDAPVYLSEDGKMTEWEGTREMQVAQSYAHHV